MAYGVVEELSVASDKDKALVRSVVSASDMENGFVFNLLTKSTTAGEEEVWVATQPVTGALTNLWMLVSPESVYTDEKYRGIDPDVRNFLLHDGRIGTAHRIKEGDLIKVNADAISGTVGSNTYVNATDSNWQLVWGASQTASVVSYKLVKTTTMSVGLGGIGTNRISGYQLECVAVA